MYNGRKEKIVATIEARMTSSRLPGKVLLPLAGVPALEMMISRLKRSRYLDAIVVATTANATDDVVADLAERLGVGCVRGSEADVLSRVLTAAKSVSADVIVEMTGDCPFADPALVDRGIEEFFAEDVDYAANILEQTYANGFDVQVFRTQTLAEVDALTDDPIDRTHVSYYIFMHPERYRLRNWRAEPECHGPDLRVTLDERADYDVMTRIADALAPTRPSFTAADVTRYLRAHPEIVAINKEVRQKEAHEL
jgi:spore coat polysaccharide biosynthesis protein SpsF